MFVTINEDKCIGCNACIRVCPVHDANTAKLSADGNHSIIAIDNDKCISCGACVKSCVHNARDYIDDTERFFSDLRSGKDITVVVAPAFRLTEPDADAMLAKLRDLGVKLIHDISFGADICTYMHLKAVLDNKVSKIISQPCPAFVEYILKHKQSLISKLSPVHSPFGCGVVYLRKYENITGPIAFLSPCIAKKFELEDTGLAQYNVTFKKFAEYMKNIGYDKSAKFEFDNNSAFCGAIYPKPGGLKDCLKHAIPDLDVRNCEGPHLYSSLDYYEKSSEQDRPTVFDVLNCADGCISGPGTNFEEEKIFTYMSKANVISNQAFSGREKNTIRYSIKSDKQFRWFEKNLRFEDFIRNYKPKNANKISIDYTDILNAYRTLEKETESEQHYDCHACGYKSCYEMAEAIAKGVNIPENCHQYVIKQAQKAHDNSVQAREYMEEQNRITLDTVVKITDDIEKICDNTDIINSQCDNNNSEMGSVQEAIDLLNTKCDEINSAIASIIEVNARYQKMSEEIANINDQTHILSINASIEASRAGESGKTFSVVAQEIRTLAANTKATTSAVAENDKFVKQETDRVLDVAHQIENLVENLQTIMQSVTDNVKNTSETSENVKAIAENIRKVAASLK